MGLGRFCCVALPFILTAVSLVCLLIVGLAGVTSSNLHLFEVNPKNLSISLQDFSNLDFKNKVEDEASKVPGLGSIAGNLGAAGNANITAADLGLGDTYDFFLWNYAEVLAGVTTKSPSKFNYAANFTNTTAIEHLSEEAHVTVAIPNAVNDGLKVFATLVKWTEVVFIIACGTTILTILVGIAGFFSRIGSCVTWIVSGLSSIAIIAFAVLATVTSSIVVGTLTASVKRYGVTSSVNVTWLVIAWIGAAASLASGLFWLFSVCCCASSRGDKRHSRAGDSEKLLGGPRGYQPVRDPFQNEPYLGQQSGVYNQQQHSIPMHNVKNERAQAYEPYSHHAV